jgi:hypothetical protein
MDILRLYQSHPPSPQLQQECEKAYHQLQDDRLRTAKTLLPLSLLVALTSFRRRPLGQICRNFLLMAGGGMAVHEVMAWNSLSAKVYLLLRATSNNE